MKCPRCKKRHDFHEKLCPDCIITINRWLCLFRDSFRTKWNFDICEMPTDQCDRLASFFVSKVSRVGLERAMELAEDRFLKWLVMDKF